MNNRGPAAFAFDHFEKALLAAAVITLALVSVRFLQRPPLRGLDLDDLRAKQASILEYSKTSHVVLPPIDVGTKRVKRQLDRAQTPSASAFPTWLMHRRPHFFTEHRRRRIPVVVHATPSQLKADTTRRDQIDLRWKPGRGHAHVALRPFEVQRAEADPDFKPTEKRPLTWKVLARVGPDAPLTYLDRTVRAGRAYRYRVISIAAIDSEDAATREFGLKLDQEQARKATGTVGPFVPKPSVYVRVTGGTPNQNEALRFHGARAVDVRRYPRVGRADLRVWVWSPAGFREATVFGIAEGAPIQKVKGRGERKRVVLETGHTLRRVRLARIDRKVGGRTYQVVGIVVEIQGPDGRRWSIVQHQPLPEELARRD